MMHAFFDDWRPSPANHEQNLLFSSTDDSLFSSKEGVALNLQNVRYRRFSSTTILWSADSSAISPYPACPAFQHSLLQHILLTATEEHTLSIATNKHRHHFMLLLQRHNCNWYVLKPRCGVLAFPVFNND